MSQIDSKARNKSRVDAFFEHEKINHKLKTEEKKALKFFMYFNFALSFYLNSKMDAISFRL